MRINLLGDFHYSRMENGTEEMLQARDKAFQAMLSSFLEMEGQFHISLGDLTHEGYPEEFQYVFDQVDASGRNFIHVLGNHDTYSIPKADILGITRQQRYSAVDTDEVLLIFLDSTKEMDHDDWGGEMDAEQLEWLQAQLERSGEKPVFVFAHHPIYETTTRSTMDKLSIHPQFDMKSILSQKKGLGFYFCGHNHANSIFQENGWHYIQTAACLDIPAIRIVELKDGQVRTQLLTMDHEELMTHIACFNTRMKGFAPVLDARGVDTDWVLEVNLLEAVK